MRASSRSIARLALAMLIVPRLAVASPRTTPTGSRAVAALRSVVDEWAAVRRDLAKGVARMPSARERLRRALSR